MAKRPHSDVIQGRMVRATRSQSLSGRYEDTELLYPMDSYPIQRRYSVPSYLPRQPSTKSSLFGIFHPQHPFQRILSFGRSVLSHLAGRSTSTTQIHPRTTNPFASDPLCAHHRNKETIPRLETLCVVQVARTLLHYRSPIRIPSDLAVSILEFLSQDQLCIEYLELLLPSNVYRLTVRETNVVDGKWAEIISQYQNLIELDLNGCDALTDKHFADIFQKLSLLTHVNLSDCLNLSTAGIRALGDTATQLTHLSLSNVRHLSNDMCRRLCLLTNLVHLDLSRCDQLTSRGFSRIGMLRSLTFLNLEGCSRLGSGIEIQKLGQLRSLVYLNISWCRRIGNDAAIIFHNFTDLTFLNISKTSLTGECFKYLCNCQSLQALHAAGCVISEVHIPDLYKLQSLKILNVEQCGLDDILLRKILEGPWQFHEIHLSFNTFTDHGLSLIEFQKALQVLTLDSCAISNNGCRAIAHIQTLKHLDLSDTHISDACITSLCTLQSLESLSLFSTEISNMAMVTLCNALTSLQVLNVDCRQLSDGGFTAIHHLAQLRWLDIFDVRISIMTIERLSLLKSLTHLELCGGSMDNDCVKYLCRLPLIESLNLSQNRRIDDACITFLKGLNHLKKLNLSHTSITSIGAVEVLSIQTLISVSFYGCKVDTAKLQQCAASLPKLRSLGL